MAAGGAQGLPELASPAKLAAAPFESDAKMVRCGDREVATKLW